MRILFLAFVAFTSNVVRAQGGSDAELPIAVEQCFDSCIDDYNATAISRDFGQPENRWISYECSVSLCDSTVAILQGNKLYDVTLEIDDTIEAKTETIDWTQFSLCGVFSCHHDYALLGYRVKGEVKTPPVYVYVDTDYTPPDEISTSGYQDGDARLHIGYVIFDSNEKVRVTYFVIHPNKYGPYQSRFKTSSLTQTVNEAIAYAVGGAAGAAATAGFAALFATSVAAGATAGSVVPGPGTVAGMISGAGVAVATYAAFSLSDDYIGDYLRYIG